MIKSERELYQLPEFKSLVKLPKIAAPTLLLFLSAAALLSFSFYSYAVLRAPIWEGFLFSLPAHFLFFTVMHEAAHGSISRGQALNRILGWLSASTFLAPFPGFQYVHLKHHRHVNERDLDPDYWSATRPLWLCWLTQDWYYYVVVFRDRSTFDLKFRATGLLHAFINVGLLLFFVTQGYAFWFLVCWFFSAKLTVMFLSFSFNYLPHLPHDPLTQIDKYKNTLVRSSILLDVPLVGQNLHNIHHLYPKVPFYRYRRIYELGRDFYLSQGTHEIKKPFQFY
jgi:beta-carotene hydroxylase